MRNQKGITLVYLVVTIIILIILASITITASLSSYKNMKYELVKAELEEIQEAVVEMIEDCTLEKNTDNSVTDYATYFEKKFETTKSHITGTESGVSSIPDYEDGTIDTTYSFYFTQDEIKTYFDLEVSIEAIVVDFSQPMVYDVEGFKDTDDNVYYSLGDLEDSGVSTVLSTSITLTPGTVTVSPASGTKLSTAGDTTLLKVTLTLTGDYPIKKAYYSTDGSTYIEVDYLGDCEYSDYTVSFVIYDSGKYYFKIDDTAGQTTSVEEATYDDASTE